jgi:hypothetical protein
VRPPAARLSGWRCRAATATGRHTGRGGSRSRDQGKRCCLRGSTPRERPPPAGNAQTRWFGPLDSEGGRCKLRAAEKTASAKRRPAKGLASAPAVRRCPCGNAACAWAKPWLPVLFCRVSGCSVCRWRRKGLVGIRHRLQPRVTRFSCPEGLSVYLFCSSFLWRVERLSPCGASDRSFPSLPVPTFFLDYFFSALDVWDYGCVFCEGEGRSGGRPRGACGEGAQRLARPTS